MPENPNRSIYETNYVPEQLELTHSSPYDSKMFELRMRLLQKYCAGKDVLDLCCGSGTFLVRILDQVKSITGLDFSRPLLNALNERIKEHPNAKKARVIEGDATKMPFENNSFDSVFCLASLYHIPNARQAVIETSRVLRPDGTAILEFGNKYSLATLTSKLCSKLHGWAQPYHMSYNEMHEVLAATGLEVEEEHIFQILPMFGTKLAQLLLPFSLSVFKKPMSCTVNGKMLDSIISGAPLLRRLAFRHLLVVRKKR